MRNSLAQSEKHYYRRQKQSAFIDAVSCYCSAVVRFADDLATASPSSEGLISFLIFLKTYVNSSEFGSIVAETEKVKSDLAGLRYRLLIQGKRITVTECEDELDYRADVLATFQKFKEGAAKEIRFDRRFLVEMNHVEAEILDLVAQLFPEVFSYLDEYTVRRAGFTDATIARFDREVQFYIACIEFVEPLKRARLSFCFPTVSDQSKQIQTTETFDLALAAGLVQAKVPVITNDLCLAGPERVFVVTGPNQGGKTTFARTVGQLHYLASIGFPIPGRDARLFLYRFHRRGVQPFVEGGASFRTAGNLNGTNPSHYGATAGMGIEMHIGILNISPVLRYTRWAADSVRQAQPGSNPDQVELLVEVSHGSEIKGHPWGNRFSLGIIGGETLRGDLASTSGSIIVGVPSGSAGSTLQNGTATYSGLHDPLIGPMVELAVTKQLSLEVNALYHPLRYHSETTLNGTSIGSTTFNDAITWDFPVLAKYKLPLGLLKPFLEGGPSFRLPQNMNGLSTVGVATGAGVEGHVSGLKLAPTIRYVHWAGDSTRAIRNQIEILMSISF